MFFYEFWCSYFSIFQKLFLKLLLYSCKILRVFPRWKKNERKCWKIHMKNSKTENSIFKFSLLDIRENVNLFLSKRKILKWHVSRENSQKCYKIVGKLGILEMWEMRDEYWIFVSLSFNTHDLLYEFHLTWVFPFCQRLIKVLFREKMDRRWCLSLICGLWEILW